MSNWEQILKNTLEEIQMKNDEQTWNEWLKENDPAAFDEYVAECDEACDAIDAEWESRVAMMRDADTSDAYVKALES